MSYTEEEKEQVKEILLEHHGADNPVTSREINERLDLDNVGSFPTTRSVIREILMVDGVPVASNSNGYYIIETDEELENYVDRLGERINNIAERKYGVLAAADEWDSTTNAEIEDFVDNSPSRETED